jgi:hypothetical protein
VPQLTGSPLHHAVACRVIGRYLANTGGRGVLLPETFTGESEGVDITCSRGGRAWALKVKADAYFGTEPGKIADRALAFYRREGSDYAFEAISNNVTRQPGWIFQSQADQLYYYFLALGQPESEIAALLAEPDAVFFAELKVERDDLHVIPMEQLRGWFETHFEDYTPRPVLMGDHSAWYRLVPRDVLRATVPVTVVGPVFETALRD